MEMARCFLFKKNFQKASGIVINIVVYLLNKLSIKVVEKTPFETWYGVKLNVEHLRILKSLY